MEPSGIPREIDPRYNAVAARAANWDTLLWQMPALTIAAQAFLMTIALGAGTSQAPRIIALTISIGTLFLAIVSMARQRQSSITDARILAGMELNAGFAPDQRAHGESWRDARNATEIGYPDLEWVRFQPRTPTGSLTVKRATTAFIVWVNAFLIFMGIDLLLIVLIAARPDWFA